MKVKMDMDEQEITLADLCLEEAWKAERRQDYGFSEIMKRAAFDESANYEIEKVRYKANFL